MSLNVLSKCFQVPVPVVWKPFLVCGLAAAKWQKLNLYCLFAKLNLQANQLPLMCLLSKGLFFRPWGLKSGHRGPQGSSWTLKASRRGQDKRRRHRSAAIPPHELSRGNMSKMRQISQHDMRQNLATRAHSKQSMAAM